MSVKYGLLGILARKSQHGYELKRSFEQITGGFWALNYGQIYQTLDRLESEGLVTYHVEQEVNVPDKKVYEITDEGRGALDTWLANPHPKPRPLRDELFIRLAVMANYELSPVFDLLEKHQGIYLKKMAELTKTKARLNEGLLQKSTDDLIEDLLIDAALFHAEADLKWLEHCERKLKAHQESRKN